MNCFVMMDSTPEGQFPNETMEFEVIGSVTKPGYVDYGFSGMVSYHHNVVEYFRASAANGAITLVLSVTDPAAAIALHRLYKLSGQTVRKVLVIASRDDGSRHSTLEMDVVTVARVSSAQVSNGTLFMVNLRFPTGNGNVKHGHITYGNAGRL
jgi:hypothetical protein